ncbi:MAG: hypothetical protein CMH46_10300 [Muricauda sp.]|nr:MULTISPECIES: hypothetical protein [unclassified Allomuricauda]MAU15914.1 hypothetical protein [Allomuricauda sp.]|tara:strand:+ start:156 stop:866 length:711 start_codon:yes stop_codon:yes gene_type:complete
MSEIINKLDELDSENVKNAFKELLQDYLTPAFGSISKRDFDILLFIKLQKLGIFTKNPEIYEIVSELRVTRAKARNLLYESKLRQTSKTELDQELKEILKTPIFLKDNDKIGIEIDNPYLIDHLRAKLKQLNHITDGSFSPELVRLTTDAFVSLFESYLPEESKDEIKQAFIDIGAEADTSLKGVLKGAFKKLGSKIADEAGGQVAESVGEYLGPIISGSIDLMKNKFTGLFTEEE